MKRDRPPILTERGFDRRLAAMVAIAFALHFVVLGILALLGEFRIRPRADSESYTVEVVDGGELGGHMPSGLPDVRIGPAGPRRPAPRPPAPPKAPPPPPEPPKLAQAPPPLPEVKPEPPPPPKPEPKPEPKAEEPKPPSQVLAEAEPDEGEKLIVPATPTPVRATPRPTPPPAATPRPTAPPTAAPTRKPAPSATPPPAPRPSPTAIAIAKPAPTRTPAPAPPRPTATPAEKRGAAPTPTPKSRDAQIADALARVQQRVGQTRPPAEPARPPGEAPAERPAAPGAMARGPATGGESGGGVGGTDAPDASRRIGVGPGAGGAGKVRGLEFLLYYNQMIARIRSTWAWAGGKPDLVVKVRFRILDDGTISELRVTEPSGDRSYDASVVRAVRGASPLSPPPAAYRNDFADVELTFQPSDLKAPG
ncbi:MAG TPA: cell envelope integrity protein TolA [Candidatus Binatia bacterium]|nr:cell envelope integrity protein TolA [Candidatus Binatia bacterium]